MYIEMKTFLVRKILKSNLQQAVTLVCILFIGSGKTTTKNADAHLNFMISKASIVFV